jgi:uncharacterized protein Veg
MKDLKYITNDKDEREGIFIDLKALRKRKMKKNDLVKLFEDMEDMVAIELSKNEKSVSYENARKEFFGRK